MKTTEKQSFFALTAWRLGGACVRRAAMTLLLAVLTTATARADVVHEYNSSTYTLTISGDGVIDDWAYSDSYYYIEHVIINDGITGIGDYAFYDCRSLLSVTIPNSVTTIGDYAFYDCRSLSSVTIGNSVTTIGDYAFYDCRSLSSVTIGNSVTTIGSNAFSYCTSLSSVIIGSGVQTIGASAFGSLLPGCIAYVLPSTPPTLGSSAVGSIEQFYVHGDAYSSADGWSRLRIAAELYAVNIGEGITATGSPVVSEGDTGYYGSGATVTLSATPTVPDGYIFRAYTVTKTADGSDVTADVLSGTTLTVPSYDVTIGATFTALPVSVSYTDKNGAEQTVVALPLQGGGATTLAGGWYIVNSDVSYTGTVTLTGNVNLILADGKTMSVGTEQQPISNGHGIVSELDERDNIPLYPLTIYGQSTEGDNMGALKAYSSGNEHSTICVADYTQYGGNVTAKGTDQAYAIDIGYGTVSGGDLDVTGDIKSGGFGMKGGDLDVTGDIYGSRFTMTGGTATVTGDISAASNITLGWTNAADRIYATSYNGTVTIADGQSLHNGSEVLSSTVSDMGKLNGKTLVGVDVLEDAATNDIAALATRLGGKQTNVALNGRTLYKDGAWNTLCLPFDVTVGSGQMVDATAMTLNASLSGFDSDGGVLTLNFTSVASGSTIEAGTPFIVKWTGSNVSAPVFSGVTVNSTTASSVTSTDGKVQFVGTYSPVDIYSQDHSNLYLGSGNTLYYPEGENMNSFPINACRAYFHVDPDGQYEVRAIVLNFGDEETGITTTNYTDFTDSDDAWYTLDGRKLSGKPSQRGVYIHGGRKIAVQ